MGEGVMDVRVVREGKGEEMGEWMRVGVGVVEMRCDGRSDGWVENCGWMLGYGGLVWVWGLGCVVVDNCRGM